MDSAWLTASRIAAEHCVCVYVYRHESGWYAVARNQIVSERYTMVARTEDYAHEPHITLRGF